MANFGLSLQETTCDWLKASGLRTGWFGKSHLGYRPEFHPLRRGFDDYFGFSAAPMLIERQSDSNNPILRGTNRVSQIDHTTDAFGRRRCASSSSTKLGRGLLSAVQRRPRAAGIPRKYLARFRRSRTRGAAPSPRCSAMDDAVAARENPRSGRKKTLDLLHQRQRRPDGTDHIGQRPVARFKAQTWEGGIRVPWIVQWKGRIPAGQVDNRPVIQLDIHPPPCRAGVDIKPEWKLMA